MRRPLLSLRSFFLCCYRLSPKTDLAVVVKPSARCCSAEGAGSLTQNVGRVRFEVAEVLRSPLVCFVTDAGLRGNVVLESLLTLLQRYKRLQRPVPVKKELSGGAAPLHQGFVASSA